MEQDKSHVGMMNCFLCNEPKGLLLDRRLKDSLPHSAVYDKEPCDKCKEHMKQGIIIISTRDGESGENPYRTGGWWVVKEEMIKRLIKPKALLNDVLKKRVLFMEDTICTKVGLEKAGEDTK